MWDTLEQLFPLVVIHLVVKYVAEAGEPVAAMFVDACSSGRLGTLQRLERLGITADLLDRDGHRALAAACRGRHLPVARLVLAQLPRSAPLVTTLDTALVFAALDGAQYVVRFVVENCLLTVPATAVAIRSACINGHLTIAEHLWELGVGMTSESYLYMTVFYKPFLYRVRPKERLSVYKWLWRHALWLPQRGLLEMQYMINENHLILVTALVHEDIPLLNWLMFLGFFNMARVLSGLAAGVSAAARAGAVQSLRWAKVAGFDIRGSDNNKHSNLRCAASSGSLDAVKLIFESGYWSSPRIRNAIAATSNSHIKDWLKCRN